MSKLTKMSKQTKWTNGQKWANKQNEQMYKNEQTNKMSKWIHFFYITQDIFFVLFFVLFVCFFVFDHSVHQINGISLVKARPSWLQISNLSRPLFARFTLYPSMLIHISPRNHPSFNDHCCWIFRLVFKESFHCITWISQHPVSAFIVPHCGKFLWNISPKWNTIATQTGHKEGTSPLQRPPLFLRHPPPPNMLVVCSSEDLWCWGAWDTLHAGTKSNTHPWFHCGQRCRERQPSMIFFGWKRAPVNLTYTEAAKADATYVPDRVKRKKKKKEKSEVTSHRGKKHFALLKGWLSVISELAVSYSQAWVWRQGVDGSIVFTLDHLSTKQQCQCQQNAMGNKFVLLWNTREQNSSENANSTPRHLRQFSKHLLRLLVHFLALLNNKCLSNACLAGVASMHSMSQANLSGCYGHTPGYPVQSKNVLLLHRGKKHSMDQWYKACSWKRFAHSLHFQASLCLH